VEEQEYANLLAKMAECREEPELCEDAFREACQERWNWTTHAMVMCEVQIHRYLDDQMDVVFRRVMAAAQSRNANLHAHIRSEQRAWLSYRDLRCGTYPYFQGTIWRVVTASCYVEMTRTRIEDLKEVETGADLASEPLLDWDYRAAVRIDLDCDGDEDQVVPGIRMDALGGGVTIGILDSDSEQEPDPIWDLPVDSALQSGICAVPVALKPLQGKVSGDGESSCPILRIDDGQCDAVFLSRRSPDGSYSVSRN